MEIERVDQIHRAGCSPACIAMVLGRSYESVAMDFGVDFEVQGITPAQVMDYLADHGCSIATKELRYWNHPHTARGFVSEPFAPVHIVTVKQFAEDSNYHSLVMTESGDIINPNPHGLTSLSSYYQIVLNTGVWRQ